MNPRLDRLVPLLTLILAGLGVVFLLDANPAGAVFNLGGSLPKISVAWSLVAVLCGLSGAGVEFIVRAHPRFQRRLLTSIRLGRFEADLLAPWWILPALTPAAIFAFFRLFRGEFGTAAYLGVLGGTGLILLAVYVMQHWVLFGTTQYYDLARTGLSVVAYILAFSVFAAVMFNRYRTLYAALLLVPAVTLLGYDLLRRRRQQAWSIALAIAVVLIESYWVLGFWPAPFLLNAAALLLLFYAAIGMMLNSSEQRIERAVLIEYGLLTLGGLLVIALAAFFLSERLVEGLG